MNQFLAWIGGFKEAWTILKEVWGGVGGFVDHLKDEGNKRDIKKHLEMTQKIKASTSKEPKEASDEYRKALDAIIDSFN